jgi:hypothetical protein
VRRIPPLHRPGDAALRNPGLNAIKHLAIDNGRVLALVHLAAIVVLLSSRISIANAISTEQRHQGSCHRRDEGG